MTPQSDDPSRDDYVPETDDDLGEECGRWINGRLSSYYHCSHAGTEFCDWDCPYGYRAQVVKT